MSWKCAPCAVQMILNKPIEQWPRVAALLVWESSGFPLHKAQRYARKIKPFLVNDVFMQDNLLDRRKVYNTLTKNMIPLPPHIIVDRSKEQIEKQQDPEGFEETHDYVAMVRSVYKSVTIAAANAATLRAVKQCFVQPVLCSAAHCFKHSIA
jgi:Diphosphoinositol pentakisphosphate kinase 2 N-terminal domain